MADASRSNELSFAESPIPRVPLEVIEYLMALPEETRIALGNFLLDSTVEGFDGTSETSVRLWEDELKRRIAEAQAHPELMLTSDQVFSRLRQRLEQLRRTPRPDHFCGYHCHDYFADGWAENGSYDQSSHTWVVSPFGDLSAEQQFGFIGIGGPGVDGIKFCYRYGHRGLWAFYPITKQFEHLAPTLGELVDGWRSGQLRV
jgi:Putative addiction module component